VWGEIPEIVEPALAGGADLGRAHQRRSSGTSDAWNSRAVMRMDSGRRAKRPGAPARDGDGGPRALECAAGDDHATDTDRHGCGDDVVPVVSKLSWARLSPMSRRGRLMFETLC